MHAIAVYRCVSINTYYDSKIYARPYEMSWIIYFIYLFLLLLFHNNIINRSKRLFILKHFFLVFFFT